MVFLVLGLHNLRVYVQDVLVSLRVSHRKSKIRGSDLDSGSRSVVDNHVVVQAAAPYPQRYRRPVASHELDSSHALLWELEPSLLDAAITLKNRDVATLAAQLVEPPTVKLRRRARAEARAREGGWGDDAFHALEDIPTDEEEEDEGTPALALLDKPKPQAVKPPVPKGRGSANHGRTRLFRRTNPLQVRVATDAHSELQVPDIVKTQAAFRGMRARRQLRRTNLIEGSYTERTADGALRRTRSFALGTTEAHDSRLMLRDQRDARQLRVRIRPRVALPPAEGSDDELEQDEQQRRRRMRPTWFVWAAYGACMLWNFTCAVFAMNIVRPRAYSYL